MSATEIKLVALAEGKEMGLFILGDETHLMKHIAQDVSHNTQLALGDVLWARALNELYDNVPLAFDLIKGFRSDPFASDHFSLTEYGGIDTYLLSDDHTLWTCILTCEMLLDHAFDLIHWLHIEQSRNFHDLRHTPIYRSEGGSRCSTFQDDFIVHLHNESSC
jgi:hypothetical protein